MPGLILLRHAKSDWQADDGGDDHGRPLSGRGREAAKTMGRFLARSGQVPDAAVTSPALRAEDTLRRAMKAGGWTCPVRMADALYGAGLSGLLAEVHKESVATGLLLAVGHEPTWSEAVAAFVGGARLRFPTGALVRIDFDVESWEDVRTGIGVLAWMVPPRLLA